MTIVKKGWAIRESLSPFRYWPKEMPFPALFQHKAEAADKVRQLMDFGFPAIVVPIELHESIGKDSIV